MCVQPTPRASARLTEIIRRGDPAFPPPPSLREKASAHRSAALRAFHSPSFEHTETLSRSRELINIYESRRKRLMNT
ncbi:hypothetical protein EYF80_062946 [Liparis tanakae]|uniref:Uncharacterized protein n=1 Tax=Liparis tanakae TaxID=230148 RepID=A0A4Z2EF23_9TELE|nr:hypothetical protein EYF80_062946 [Liparis tanakae]